jgi:hypothetical protein
MLRPVGLLLDRHGRACPGYQKRHPATTDGRDTPGHDGTNEWGWKVIVLGRSYYFLIAPHYRRSPSVTSRCQMYSPDAISTATPAKLQTSGHSPQIAIPSTVA